MVFVFSVLSVISANPAINPLACGCLSCLRHFRDSRRFHEKHQGPLNGGGSKGGFPDLDLSFLFCPFLSFLGLSLFFWDFPGLLGDGPGIFPICPFPLSQPIKSTYKEQSRKGPRHNLDISRKKWETPSLETLQFSFSQKHRIAKNTPRYKTNTCRKKILGN